MITVIPMVASFTYESWVEGKLRASSSAPSCNRAVAVAVPDGQATLRVRRRCCPPPTMVVEASTARDDTPSETSTSTITTAATATRHEDLWFRDGNIVLATHTLLFRVHKSILSLHSSVFRDMFELVGIESYANDAEGTSTARMTPGLEVYDGVPLVSLPSDEGVDVEELLLAVYDRLYVFSSL